MKRAYLFIALAVTSCATVSSHRFAEPTADWQTRSGQLLYRNASRTVIGDVLVRTSPAGDFELTFAKGPGVALLRIRQDASHAAVSGALARMGWSGATASAPKQLRGWLGLREAILRAPQQRSIHHSFNGETFHLRF